MNGRNGCGWMEGRLNRGINKINLRISAMCLSQECGLDIMSIAMEGQLLGQDASRAKGAGDCKEFD